jgi:pimeloyl-ACP methyl ester carboxylesterase
VNRTVSAARARQGRRRPDLFPLPEPHTRLRPRSGGGVHLNVEVHGPDAAPTVVLIHGWTCSIPFWAPVISALREDLRVVVYDQRGHGASDVPGQGHYSVQALVDDLTAVLDAALPPGQKAILAGHSMGGMTIMAAALRPSILSRAHSALLTSTGFTELAAAARIFPFAARNPVWGARATRRVMGSRLPLGPVTPVASRMLKYGTLGPQASKQLARYNASVVHACRPRPRAAWGHVLDSIELSDALQHLALPTSVLVGTADRLTPPAQARGIVEALPQCEGLTELPGIGHMTPLEAPDVVVDLIRKLAALPGADPADPAPAPKATP